ncbi:Crp/Fnr family transcriptional regulator [Flammeovirga sp. OC4]|uniref:Crp/Fnr family transcriptional regulator n=1 Tax=Flammeovirga sp. OC4 TaxID=1382345 RepID=UPI0005C620E0|nr:Crp/Fnr family transcriptional regulator [Flammeovirga sp. OC4]
MQEIESYIKEYFGIGGKSLASVSDLFTFSEINKNDYLLKLGQYSNTIHFVKSGYLRMFAYNENGDKEITQWISSQGMFVADLSSFMFQTPSRWNIQALSHCELFTITKDDFHSIEQYVEDWGKLEKLFITKCFITLENRVFGQLSMTAEEKVKHLLDTNPSIFLNVPLQYIASMLGMTPETLSRVRRKMIS